MSNNLIFNKVIKLTSLNLISIAVRSETMGSESVKCFIGQLQYGILKITLRWEE